MSDRLVEDCFRQDVRGQAYLPHHEAVQQLRDRIKTVTGAVTLDIARSNGRICAEPVYACRPVPGHTNAAVDGYAFAHDSLVHDSFVHDRETQPHPQLRLTAQSVAGGLSDRVVAAGEAARILTGAVLPVGCDTVAMQENCELDTSQGHSGAIVRIPSGIVKGANMRQAGEDISVGDRLVDAGNIIRPQDIAALASVGCAQVTCFAPPRVAIFSSGDEIVRAGASDLRTGQVYDTNGPMLLSLAANAGADVTDLGILPDRLDDVTEALRDAARNFDLIVTSGGAGRSEKDHIAGAIEDLGTCYFWHISVKPGKPLMFGQIHNTAIAGLPGNPVAAFVCFLMYIHPIIRQLGGAAWPEPRRFALPAAFDVTTRKSGRREFWRGFIRQHQGAPGVEKFGRDGSGIISSLRAADGLIEIEEHITAVRRGDTVNFIPFSEFGLGV